MPRSAGDAGVALGATVVHNGVALDWPAKAGDATSDNTLAAGQIVKISGTGDTLGFLVSAGTGPAAGDGKVHSFDGTLQLFTTLSSPDWSGTGTVTVVTTAYTAAARSRTDPAVSSTPVCRLQAGRTMVSVTPPDVSVTLGAGKPVLHVYAMRRGIAVGDLGSAFDNVAVTQDTATGRRLGQQLVGTGAGRRRGTPRGRACWPPLSAACTRRGVPCRE